MTANPPLERTAAAVYFTCGRASRVRRRGRSTASRYRAAAIQLLPIIFIALLGTAAATIVALVSRKRRRAAAWFGACVVLATCGVLLIQSWNRVMLRVNQIAPATQAAR